MAIAYFDYEACEHYAFPYIYKKLTFAEQAPDYASETNGVKELKKVLELVQQEYYPTFEAKAAYIVCSIAASQYFSNGNKRLSVVVLLMFLMKNNMLVFNNYNYLKSLLSKKFPKHAWEDDPKMDRPHSLFLYNLAIILGDRNRWNSPDFSKLKEDVADMFKSAYVPREGGNE